MVIWKEYIKSHFLHKKLHFTADCIIPIDVTGQVVDLEWLGGEVVFHIMMDNGKISKIGSNTKDLKFEFL